MLRFSANISMLFRERPLLDRFAAARDAGFPAVEIQFPYDTPVDDLIAAKERAGVSIAVFNIPVGDMLSGGPGLAAMRAGLHTMAVAGYITEYDMVVGDQLASILCGGEVAPGSRVSEQYLLDLEREAFMTLCGDPRTQARMEHILTTGKPLRN